MTFLFKQPQLDRQVIYMDLSTYIEISRHNNNMFKEINDTYYTLYSPELKLELDEMLYTAPSGKENIHQNFDLAVTKMTKGTYTDLSKQELLGEDISKIYNIEVLGESQKYINQRYSKGIYTTEEQDISKEIHLLKKSDNQHFQDITQKAKPLTMKQLNRNVKAKIKSQLSNKKQISNLNKKETDKLIQETLQKYISKNEDMLCHYRNNDPPPIQIKNKIESVFRYLHYEFEDNRDIIPKIESERFLNRIEMNRIKNCRIEHNSILRFIKIMKYHFILDSEYELNPIYDASYHDEIYNRWLEKNCPTIIEFAPYTDYIAKIYMATAILAQNRLIETNKNSHVWTDTNYLTYLPYCNIFVTQDQQQKFLAEAIIEAAKLNVEVKTYEQNKTISTTKV